MNQNICVTLIKAIEEIEGINFNHNQELLLLPQTIDPYASDEEIGDDDTGLGENLDQPAEITGKLSYIKKSGEMNLWGWLDWREIIWKSYWKLSSTLKD